MPLLQQIWDRRIHTNNGLLGVNYVGGRAYLIVAVQTARFTKSWSRPCVST